MRRDGDWWFGFSLGAFIVVEVFLLTWLFGLSWGKP